MDYIDLEGEQLTAMAKCLNHIINKPKDDKFLIFGAYAGSGKTHSLRRVTGFLRSYGVDVSVIAFTGRAASQLSKDGVDAITCHSLLYKPRIDSNGNLVGWDEKDTSEVLETCRDGIVVDEGSMIPLSIHNALDRLGVKVIYAGDFGQLPPVDLEGSDFNAMTSVPGEVVSLVENRRFDVNSGIGHIAMHLRDHDSIPRVKKEGLLYVKKTDVFTEKFHRQNQYDVILCGMNKTRKKLNSLVRRARAYYDDIPEVGERVICLRNSILSDGSRINNGDLFYVEGVFPGKVVSTYMLRREDGKIASVAVLNACWEAESSPMMFEGKQVFSFGFGYALSVHKAQGSTFDSVLFVDEDVSFFLDRQKFRYTGCTRAARELTLTL